MATSFLVVPQWQGSVSARALRLRDGAEAILGDLPPKHTVLVDVPLGAGDAQGSGVHRLTAIQLVRNQMLDALDGLDGTPITIGGDCGVSLAAILHAGRQHGGFAVLWLDAHPDLNTPETSPSGAFGGMVLRTLLGDGLAALLPDTPLSPDRLVLAGTRALDDAEVDYIDSTGLAMIGADDTTADSVLDALTACGTDSVYVHIDLDVLDPGQLSSLDSPVPFGLSVPALIELIQAVKGRFHLVGATIAAFSPASPDQAADDLPSILRVIGALAA